MLDSRSAIAPAILGGLPGSGADLGVRVTATCGPFRVAARFPPGLATGRQRPWLDPPGLPADLEATVEIEPLTPRDRLTFSRLDCDGCRFEAPSSAADVDFTSKTATFRLPDVDDDRERGHAAVEVMLATAYAEVLLRGGVGLHGACLWLDGLAYVVFGPSTAGKTTLANRFPQAWLHDELTFLVPSASGGVCGWEVWRQAEWRGAREPRPWTLPLGGLLALGPDRTQTAVTPLESNEALSRLLACQYYAGGVATPLLLDGAIALAQACPPGELSHCLADAPDVVARRIVEGCRG